MISPELNLYNPSFRPIRLVLDARRALLLWLLGVTAILAWAAVATGVGRDQGWSRTSQQLAVTQQERLMTLTREVEARAKQMQVERDRLLALEAALARTTAALTEWPGSQGLDHAAMLRALSNTTHPSLWITGLRLAGDPEVVELRGQMLDAAVLPGYLRSLNEQPVFRGRHFEQLGIKTVRFGSGPESPQVAEFDLRSNASTTDTQARPR